MSSPDVRVRLSAEGVSEVVAALRKVRAESEAAAGGATKSFRGFGNALSGARQLAAQLAAAFAVGQITAFVRQASEAADQVGKLSQKVGASTENISALAVGARTADVELEGLQQSLGQLAQKLVQLAAGSPEAVRAFGSLGLEARDFRGKDTVEAFELIALRMGQLRDGADKTAIAMAIFGKRGAQLIPLFNDLSEGGLERLKERARELGLLLDGDLARTLQAMNDDFALLGAQAQGIGQQFAAGLAPDVRRSVLAISNALKGEGVVAFREFGKVVGTVIRLVTGAVVGAAELIRSLFTDIALRIQTLGDVLPKFLRGDQEGARAAFESGLQARLKNEKATRERLEQLLKDLRSPAPEAGPLRGGTQGSAANAAEIFQKRAELLRSLNANELRLQEAKIAAEDEATQQQYRDGLISAEVYFRRRRALIESEAAARIGSIARARLAAQEIEDPIQRRIELQKLETDLAIENVRINGQRAKLDQERLRALRELGARLIEVDRETANAELSDLQALAQERLNDLTRERQSIQDQIDTGRIGEIEGERQLLALQEQRLPELEAIAAEVLRAAEATNNPEMIAWALNFGQAIRRTRFELQQATDSLSAFRSAAGDTFRSSLQQTFAAVGKEIQSVGDFWRALVANVLDGLQQIATQQLATSAWKGIFGLIPGFAEGGLVRGPGGPRSDSILARLSPGEFVLRADAVNQPGIRELAELINASGGWQKMIAPLNVAGALAMPHPHFADGGLVKQGPQSVDGRIEVGLEDGLVLRALKTPEGQKAVIKVIGQNRRSIGRVIG